MLKTELREIIANGEGSGIDSGLIERFMTAMKPLISQEAGEIDEDLRRETKWFYPLEAVRKVLLNALAHRDWTRFVDIEVAKYSNRL